MRRFPLVPMLLLLGGCANNLGVATSQDVLAEPAYGPVVEITGIAEYRSELTTFEICLEASCRHLASGKKTCWLVRTDEFVAQLNYRSSAHYKRRRNRWHMQFRGRIADNGNFGRGGAYRCQVEAQWLSSVRPWGE